MANTLKTEVDKSFKELISILSSIDQPQLNKVPFKGSWTAGQVADHLFRSYDAASVLKGRIENAHRPVDKNVGVLKDIFMDFETKMQSPDFIIPTNEPINKESLLDGLIERTQAIVEVSENEDLSYLCLDFEFPDMGHLTRFEWINFINFHTIRHIHQLKNIINHLKA